MRRHGDGHQRVTERRETAGPPLQEGVIDEILLAQHAEQRQKAEDVGARADLEVEIGALRGLAAPGIDATERPRRIGGDGLERHAGAGESMRLPGVRADEDGHLGVLEVAAGVAARAAVELLVDARVSVGERACGIHGPQRRAGGARIRAAQVVPLPASCVIEDGLAAMGVAHTDRGARRPRPRRSPSRPPRRCRQGGVGAAR